MIPPSRVKQYVIRRAVEPRVKRLEQAVAQTPREWHPSLGSKRRQPIDNDRGPLPLRVAQLVEPFEYLVVGLDLSHSRIITHVMIAQERS